MRLYITGNIGVGKSTLAQYIANKYNYIHYPEFNSYDIGDKLLHKRLTGRMDIPTFQIEIMNIYSTHRKYDDDHNYVIERLASEGYNIFTDDVDRDYVYGMYKLFHIDEPHNLLVYHLDITHGLDSIKDEVDYIIRNQVSDLCIYLYTDINTLMHRIRTRARPGEDKYDVKYIQKIQDRYDQIYRSQM